LNTFFIFQYHKGQELAVKAYECRINNLNILFMTINYTEDS